MTINELKTIIESKQRGRSFSLQKGDIVSQDIDFIFDKILKTDRLSISNAELSSTDEAVTITGKSNILNVYDAPAVANFSIVNENPVMKVEYKLPELWKFQDTFDELPACLNFSGKIPAPQPGYLEHFTFTESRFILSSYDQADETSEREIKKGLNFDANMDLPDSYDQVLLFCNGNKELTLSGVIDNGEEDPLMDLRTPMSAELSFKDKVKFGSLELRFISTHTYKSPRWGTIMEVSGNLEIGDTVLKLSSELCHGGGDFVVVQGVFEENPPSLGDIVDLLGGNDLFDNLPDYVPNPDNIIVKEMGVCFSPIKKNIIYVSLTLSYNGEWNIVDDKMKIRDINFHFTIVSPLDPANSKVTKALSGKCQFGNGEDSFTIGIEAEMPNFNIHGWLDEGSEIPLGKALSKLYDGFEADDNGIYSTKITELNIYAEPPKKATATEPAKPAVYSAAIEIESDWEFEIMGKSFSIKSVGANINYENGSATGELEGGFFIGDIPVNMHASYDGVESGWTFSCSTGEEKKIDLGRAADSFLPFDLPDFLSRDLCVSNLNMIVSPKLGIFNFGGKLDWKFKMGNVPINLNANIDLNYAPVSTNELDTIPNTPPPETTTKKFSGKISTKTTIKSFGMENVELSYEFKTENGVPNKRLAILWPIPNSDKSISALYNMESTPTGVKKEIEFNLTDISFSDIIELLIKPVKPGFELPSFMGPLDSVNLLALRLNLTDKSFEVDLSITLPSEFNEVLRIDKITLISKKIGGKRKALFRFEGTILGQTYSEGNPLEWDVTQPPPSTTPKKPILDMRYMGMGQHVTVTDIEKCKRVKEALEKLKNAARPVDDIKAIPTTGALTFSKQSNWLIGTDFTVLDTVTMRAIFNDPNLYGLFLALDGPRAGKLKGLEFEIMYSKVSEDIGRYFSELTLPWHMRQFELGAVSITLPVIAVEVFTNSNFKIDVGFPVSIDNFSRSGNAQLFPFIGYAGFYFASLNGKTSTRVPRTVKGDFNPVLEFGFALSIGVGKSFNKGPLKAEIQISLRGMIEGCLGWFHPYPRSLAKKDTYYWIKGQVGLLGRVYGCIDFKIIKASVLIELLATISMVIEAYRKIPVQVSARVKASVTVKVAFIKIHKSFSTTVKKDFTIGSDKTAPWDGPMPVTNRSAAMMATAAPQQVIAVRENSIAMAPMMMSSVAAPEEVITLKLVPIVSEVRESDITLTGNSNAPIKTCTTMLLIENSIKNDADTQDGIREVTKVNNEPVKNSFDILMDKYLEWLLKKASKDSDIIGYDDLVNMEKRIKEDYEEVDKVDLSYNSAAEESDFDEFLKTLSFNIVEADENEGEKNMSVFPMFPELIRETETEQCFHNAASWTEGSYEQDLENYFNDTAMSLDN